MKDICSGAARTAMLVAALFAANAMAADIAKIEESCATCHGKDGASTDPDVPIIGGISKSYFEYNLNDYKAKKRPCPDATYKTGPNKDKKTNMCDLAKDLSGSDITALAKLYAGKKFVHAVQKSDPVLAKKGKDVHEENCEKCHANAGTDVKDDAGMLAGQWSGYLRKELQAFKAGKRKAEQKMQPAVDALSPTDIEALLNYYAGVK